MDNVSNEELAQRIKDFNFAIRQREKTNRIEKQLVEAYQSELDKRFLEAYWLQHPELTRVEIGDKLRVTKMGRKHVKGLKPTLDTIVCITGLEKGNIIFGTFRCSVPIYVASEMRDAYFEQLEQSQE